MKKRREVERAEKRLFWEAHLRKWKASGLSQAEYCRKNNLKANRLLYWKKRIPCGEISATLVELPIQKSMFSSSPLYLSINGVYRIEINQGFDSDTLDRVIRILM